MGARLGLVGLPNVGKSTLFNALTQANAAVAPYPFTTIDQNVGVAQVQDERLQQLSKVVVPQQIIPATVEFVDIAGLVKGAHQGEGLGNQFLSHIFAVDALLHVVRCFDDPNVPHAMQAVDPLRDIDTINTELLLKDLDILDRRREKEQKLAKGQDKQAMALMERLESWRQSLDAGNPIRCLELPKEDQPRTFGIDFLSAKPVLYALNTGETLDEQTRDWIQQVRERAAKEGSGVCVFCAKLESELAELDAADRAEMMKELGLSESALPQVIREGYKLLQLISFFTTASKMLQAWTIPQGTKAPQAAGVIHTDFEQRFIRAEIISAQTLIECGSESIARARGKLRLEGRDYALQDGDVAHFRIGT